MNSKISAKTRQSFSRRPVRRPVNQSYSLLQQTLLRNHMSIDIMSSQSMFDFYGRILSIRPFVTPVEVSQQLLEELAQYIDVNSLAEPVMIDAPEEYHRLLLSDLFNYYRDVVNRDTVLNRLIHSYMFDTRLGNGVESPSAQNPDGQHSSDSNSLSSADSLDELMAIRGSPDASVTPDPVVTNLNGAQELSDDFDGQ